MHTDPDFGQHGHEFIFDETIDYSAPRFRGQVNPSNLTERRWREPILSAGEVADALRATKGPEPAASAAKNLLARAFHRLVLKEAKAHCGDNQDRNDDLIAAGMLGLAEAIDRFNLNRNNGLAAFAIPLIRGRMRATAKAFNRNGWSGETRLQRLVYGDHDVTPEKASKVMGRPVDEREIEEARTQVLGMCSELESYDTREPAFENEYDEEDKRCLVAVAPPCAVQRYATLTMYRGELLWTAAGLSHYRLAHDADRRATQRLKEIGRRAYALELVARDRSGPIEHLFEPCSRGYPSDPERPPIPTVNCYWTADKPKAPSPPEDIRAVGKKKGYHYELLHAHYVLLHAAAKQPPANRSDGQWSIPRTESYRRLRGIYPTWGDPPTITIAADQYQPAAQQPMALAA
jgi:hypothetical protein